MRKSPRSSFEVGLIHSMHIVLVSPFWEAPTVSFLLLPGCHARNSTMIFVCSVAFIVVLILFWAVGVERDWLIRCKYWCFRVCLCAHALRVAVGIMLEFAQEMRADLVLTNKLGHIIVRVRRNGTMSGPCRCWLVQLMNRKSVGCPVQAYLENRPAKN